MEKLEFNWREVETTSDQNTRDSSLSVSLQYSGYDVDKEWQIFKDIFCNFFCPSEQETKVKIFYKI
jgi:hypothetical protein